MGLSAAGPGGRRPATRSPWMARAVRGLHGALGESGRPHLAVYQGTTGSNPVCLATVGPRCCGVACRFCTPADRVELPADPPNGGMAKLGRHLVLIQERRRFEPGYPCHSAALPECCVAPIRRACGGIRKTLRLEGAVRKTSRVRVRVPPGAPNLLKRCDGRTAEGARL